MDVALVAVDLARATNLAIDIRVGPFAPEESKKNEGKRCLPVDLPAPPCNAARSQRWLLALLLELLLAAVYPQNFT